MTNNQESLNNMLAYLKKQHVLSLCSTYEGEIWCANCFYVFDESDIAFYLMTAKESRHSVMMLKNNKVAGVINGQPKNISLIKGIQYRGTISILAEEDNKKASDLYINHFPIAKIKSLPLWKIEITEMKFTNNMLGFGNKSVWHRE